MAEPRKTVVVKAPGQRGPLLDIVLGVLGALLIVGAIALIPVLPVKEVIIPQYRVTVTDALVETHAESCHPEFQEAAFATNAETQEQTFVWQVCDDNVYAVKFKVYFVDDVKASLPDGFRIKLVGPNDRDLGGQYYIENGEPTFYTDPEAGTLPQYNSTPASQEFAVTFGVRPQDDIIDAASPDETPKQAQARVAEAARLPTKGTTFQTIITLDHAGGCPDPQDQPDARRLAMCSASTADAGNTFKVETLAYTFYTLEVASLEEQ